MTKRERSPFGNRLEEAIKLRGRPGSIRKFQKALEERCKGRGRERFGYSYPTINAYLQPDEPSPGIEWVREVASLLNVSSSWLAFDQGPMLETSDELWDWTETFRLDADSGRYDIVPITGGPACAELFKELLRRIVDARPDGDPEPTTEQLDMLAYRVALSVHSLRTAVGTGPIAPGAEVSRGLVAMLATLIQIIPGPAEGRSIESVTEDLPWPGPAGTSGGIHG